LRNLMAYTLLTYLSMMHAAGFAVAQEAPSAFSYPIHVRQIPLPCNDIAFDPISRKIYASLPSSYGPEGNSVVEIDPVTGKLGKPFSVGSEPTHIAISNDGKYLYVLLSGAKAVRRLNLQTNRIEPPFSIGPWEPTQIVVLPKNPAWIAVVRRRGATTGYVDVALFENGVERPGTYGGHGAPTVIALNDDGTRMYAYNGWISSYDFARWNLNRDGWAAGGDSTGSLINGYNLNMTYAGGRIYVNNGLVVDPEKRIPLGHFEGAGGMVLPDLKTGRILFIKNKDRDINFPLRDDGCVVRAYDPEKYTLKGVTYLPRVMGNPESGLIWGEGRYAFRSEGKVVFISPDMDLLSACKAHNWPLAQQFLQKDCNVNCSDEFGATSLMFAAYYSNASIAGVLVERGADVRAADGNGNTALSFAVLAGNSQLVDLLLRKGADPNAGGSLGKPLKIAQDRGRDDLIQMLQQAGGKP